MSLKYDSKNVISVHVFEVTNDLMVLPNLCEAFVLFAQTAAFYAMHCIGDWPS